MPAPAVARAFGFSCSGFLASLFPRLISDLELARGDGHFERLFRKIARVDFLILDNWGPDRLILLQLPPGDFVASMVAQLGLQRQTVDPG